MDFKLFVETLAILFGTSDENHFVVLDSNDTPYGF